MLIGLNLDQAAHALPLAGAGVVNLVALGNLAAIDPEEDQLADEFVRPEFKAETDELAVIVRGNFDFFVEVIRVVTDLRLNIERVGQVIDNGVKESLHPFVLEGGTTSHGNDLVGDDGAAESAFHVLDRDRLFFEEHHAELLVDVAESGGEIVVSRIRDGLLLRSERTVFVGGAEFLSVRIHDGLFADNVDHAFELIFGTDRDQNRVGVGSEF